MMIGELTFGYRARDDWSSRLSPCASWRWTTAIGQIVADYTLGLFGAFLGAVAARAERSGVRRFVFRPRAILAWLRPVLSREGDGEQRVRWLATE